MITRSVVRTATKPGAYQNLRANARAPNLAPKPVTNRLQIEKEFAPIVVETVEESDDEDDDNNPEEEDPCIDEEAEKKKN